MSCTRKVRETLAQLLNVEKVEVDFKAQSATITMKEGSTLTQEDVTKALAAKAYGVSSFSAKAAPAPKDEEKEDPAAALAWRARISGMTCAGCAAKVKEAVMKTGKVASVEVDTKAGSARIRMEEGATLDKAALEAALKGAGYALTELVPPRPKKD